MRVFLPFICEGQSAEEPLAKRIKTTDNTGELHCPESELQNTADKQQEHHQEEGQLGSTAILEQKEEKEEPVVAGTGGLGDESVNNDTALASDNFPSPNIISESEKPTEEQQVLINKSNEERTDSSESLESAAESVQLNKTADLQLATPPEEKQHLLATTSNNNLDSKPAAQTVPSMVAPPQQPQQRLQRPRHYVENHNAENEFSLVSNRETVAAVAPFASAHVSDPAEEDVNDFTGNAYDYSVARLPHNNPTQDSRVDGPTNKQNDEDSFRQELKKRGLEIVEQEGDGNCLFRAVSLQVYGDSNMHMEVRERCMDHMARDKEHFGKFVVSESFDKYIARKRKDGVHGNNPEIQAMAELFNRPVEVFTPENAKAPLNIFHTEYKTSDVPIRLSYHDGNHYNAVVDPLVPTAGLGLGMPGLQPGLADKLQVAKAVAESDQMADEMELERVLKESEQDEMSRAIKESMYSVDQLEQAMLEKSLGNINGARKQSPFAYNQSQNSRRRRPEYNMTTTEEGSVTTEPSFDDATSTSYSVTDTTSVACIPTAASATVATAPAAAAIPMFAVASTAAVASAAASQQNSTDLVDDGEYPPVVQELVMNGFELRKVTRAYDLVGDNFDDLLMFLMSNNNNTNTTTR